MRRRVSILLLFVLVLTLAALLARHWGLQQLHATGVQQLDWQGVQWRGGAVVLDRLQLQMVDGLQLDVRQLRLQPGWRDGLRVRALQADSLGVNLPAGPESGESSGFDPLLLLGDEQFWRRLADWAPDEAAVGQIEASLPCRDQRCQLAGRWHLRRSAQGDDVTLSSTLLLNLDGQQLSLQPQLQLAAQRVRLTAPLQIDGAAAAQLHSEWQGGQHWQGRLQIPDWPQTPWLFGYLGRWLALGALPVEQIPAAAQLELDWQLDAARVPEALDDWLAGDVQLQGRLVLPEPWLVAQLGELSGELSLQVQGAAGDWRLRQAHLQALVQTPRVTALQTLPAALQPAQLTLQLTPLPDQRLLADAALQLDVQAGVTLPQGGELTLAGPVSVPLSRNWQLASDALLLRLQAPQLSLPQLRARDVTGRWTLRVQATADAVHSALTAPGSLAWQQLQLRDAQLTLRGARLEQPAFELTLPLNGDDTLSAAGRLTGKLDALEHAQLTPQRWDLRADWRWQQAALNWNGNLSNAAGLELAHQASWRSDGSWRLDGELTPLFMRAGNPLADSLTAWPELLSFASGQVGGTLSVSSGQSLRVRGDLTLTGLKGIYDRIAFSGLEGPLQLRLAAEQLTLEAPSLALAQANPGIELGPVRGQLSYHAALAQPAGGRLEVTELRTGLLGGEVRVLPTTLDLAQREQRAELQLQGLELGRLFEVYPTEGLSGGGTLDGRLPVLLRDGQLLIDDGAVAAREPGGVLRYRSDKLQRLAAANPSMRELAGVLEDFHYTVLSSQVDYGENGNMVLGLRLQGSNPDFQQGRQVNLNVTLEENIPALLASLQLSGKVSEIIQQRVQQHLIKQRAQQP
ncbi:YdbH domain-containing protein [Halopseudomonas maritima]|uniref:YdbH domain-containing protein n=1 Tax=Halopseudomonas maritima TaxID=2918528 RepID=UPI001EEBA645|nr:YdbH domain-containing protein [Halopseudomonas maritima]UJJ30171.1 YdbH domain-containing protein [Halopseudomonas maritima]